VVAEPILRVKKLRHAYGTHVVFDGVSFALRAGDAVALVGPNGAGKSTLLRCVVGAAHPDGGELFLSGEKLDERSERFRRDVAAVLDDLDFFPDVTVLEHLDLLARAHGVPEVEATVDAVLAELDLTGPADQFPGTLSSGQRRRLALATAFVRPHKLLVLDEPEARLDVEGRAWLTQRLRAAKKDGACVLMATHDDDLVRAVADRTLNLARHAGPADAVGVEEAPVDAVEPVAVAGGRNGSAPAGSSSAGGSSAGSGSGGKSGSSKPAASKPAQVKPPNQSKAPANKSSQNKSNKSKNTRGPQGRKRKG